MSEILYFGKKDVDEIDFFLLMSWLSFIYSCLYFDYNTLKDFVYCLFFEVFIEYIDNKIDLCICLIRWGSIVEKR